MDQREFSHILAAIIIMFLTISFGFMLNSQWALLASTLFFSVIIIIVHVFSKKLMAYSLDSDVEHQVWGVSRFGIKPSHYFKSEIPAGIILPLFFSLITLGTFKFLSILTYEAKALKFRAAKRFGFYSYTELTDFHNSLIGAAGIIALLILSIILYFIPGNLEFFARITIFYAFFNMLPISNLDGTQIFFGSRVLYTTLAILTLIFTFYALLPMFITI